MDVSSIIAKSRTQTGTTVWQKTDVKMLEDLNLVYQEIFSRLNAISKKYTWQTYRSTTIAGQSEYKIPVADSVETGLKRVLNVMVKYKSSEDYRQCKMYDSSTRIDSLYVDSENPYCIVRDDSVFIYPAPTEVVTDWVVAEWQYQPFNLELTTESKYIKLKSEHHDILIAGLNARTFGDKQLFDKQAQSKALFEEWMKRMEREWWMDMESWYISEEPADLVDYE